MPKYFSLIYVFLVALTLGSVINLAIGDRTENGQLPLSGDQADYQALAIGFANDRQLGEPGAWAYRAPLYPMVLGMAYRLGGETLLVARGLNTVLGALMAVAAGLLVMKMTRRTSAVYLAAALVMIHSYWWLHQAELMTENLAAVLLAFSLWCWPVFRVSDRSVVSRIKKHGLWVAASGLLFGLSQLTKPSLLPLLLLLPLLSLILRPAEQRKTQVAFSFVFVLASLLPLGTWSARNYAILHTWVPVTTGSGEVFWGSHAPQTMAQHKGMWTSQPLPETYQQRLQQAVEQAEPSQAELIVSRLKWEAAWDSLRNEWAERPGNVGLHFATKIARLWSPSVFFSQSEVFPGAKYLLLAINAAVLLCFAWGLLQTRSDRPLLIAMIFALTLTCFIFWGTIRFQYQLLPIIASGAALTVQGKWFNSDPRREHV